jgi:hypothetical protein
MLEVHKHVLGLTPMGLILLGGLAVGAVAVAYFLAKPTDRAFVAGIIWCFFVAVIYGVLRIAGG